MKLLSLSLLLLTTFIFSACSTPSVVETTARKPSATIVGGTPLCDSTEQVQVYSPVYGCLPQGGCPPNFGVYGNYCILGSDPNHVQSCEAGYILTAYGCVSERNMCTAGQIYTIYGCLEQAPCPHGFGTYNGKYCIPAI